MPIPVASDGRSASMVLLDLFGQVHDQLRDEISGLDAAALNWVPTPGANSISTIVTHLVGSEAETLRCVAGLPDQRDRDAEFSGTELAADDVFALLDQADDGIAAVRAHIDEDRLAATIALPTLPAEETRSGLTWLVGNLGHAREHVGHIQLTRQLYGNERSSASKSKTP